MKKQIVMSAILVIATLVSAAFLDSGNHEVVIAASVITTCLVLAQAYRIYQGVKHLMHYVQGRIQALKTDVKEVFHHEKSENINIVQ